MKADPVGLALDALAVYRLVRLAQEDSLLEDWREPLLHRYADTRWGELLTCPWCLSPHVAVLVVAARAVFPRGWGVLAKVLAFSAVTGVLSQM